MMRAVLGSIALGLLLFTVVGCDYGIAEGEDPSTLIQSNPTTEQAEPGETAEPEPETYSSPGGLAAPGPEDGDEGSYRPIGEIHGGSNDCIDFSSGKPRLVPCLMDTVTAFPLGHDDPDPWIPNARLPASY